VADTEIKGVFQGDVIVRSAVIRAMETVRKDPTLLNHIFHSLAEDDITRDVYGEKQIDIAKQWFLKTDIPVVMNFRVSEQDIPCIAISLQESAEADQTHGDVHYVPQERTPGDWPVLTRPFTPIAYSPVSGIMVLPEGLMGDKVIGAGMFVMTRDGRQHEIKQNLGDDEISLTPYTSDDFTGAVIKGSYDRYITTIESVTFKEVYQLGIHVMSEPANLLYLHSIVQFMLLKYKQDLLERRGYERTQLSSTDFRRNQEFENEEVFSRYITITGFARHYWPKDTTQTLDVVDTQLDVAHLPDPPAPSFAISPFQTLPTPTVTEPDPVNDAGDAPGEDDLWGVIPLALE
jgi:hypothetical protein